MARNTKLAKVLQILKGELGLAQTPGVSPQIELELYLLLESRQTWLCAEYDWPFMELEEDVDTVAATRYYDMPATFNEDRPIKVEVLYNNVWLCLDYGIGGEQYNSLSSGDGVVAQPQDPVMRWRLKPGDPTQFETWPIPTIEQVIRFTGQRPPNSLRLTGGQDFSFNTTAKMELDDLLVALFVAAEKMGPKNEALAKVKLSLAEARLTKLRGNAVANGRSIILGQGPGPKKYTYRKPRIS